MFFSESRPKQGTFLYFKDRETGQALKCFVKTVNLIVDALPRGLELLRKLSKLPSIPTRDARYMEEDLCFYGRNKLVMIVQHHEQTLSLIVQLKFDREGNGRYVYSKRMVRFSPRDNLRGLRNFANRMGEKWIEHGNRQALLCDGPQVEIPNFEMV